MELIDSRQVSSELEKACDWVSHSTKLTILKFYGTTDKINTREYFFLTETIPLCSNKFV